MCAVGSGPADIQTLEFPTTQPSETIARAVDFLRAHAPLAAVGIASFGPIDPNPKSPTFGYITSTPKGDWRNCDFAGAVGRALGVPVAFDTDVNAAALAEFRWGAGRGLGSFIYVTVGTGIGGGAMVDGRLLHGRSHPEMGHVRIPHDIGSAIVLPATVRTTAIAWRGWRQDRQSRHVGASRRACFRTVTRLGIWRRNTWRSAS